MNPTDEVLARGDMTEEELTQYLIANIKKNLEKCKRTMDGILIDIQACNIEVKKNRAVVDELNFGRDKIDEKMTRLNSRLRESARRRSARRAQQGQQY